MSLIDQFNPVATFGIRNFTDGSPAAEISEIGQKLTQDSPQTDNTFDNPGPSGMGG